MKRVKGHQYLSERAGSLYFRRAIPPDVRQAFDGKLEYVKALGTRSVPEGRHLMAGHLRTFDQTVAAARGTYDPTSAARNASHSGTSVPTIDEIERAVRNWLSDRLIDQGLYSATASEDEIDERIGDLTNQMALADIQLSRRSSASKLSAEWIADSIAGKNGWKFAEGDHLSQHLLKTVLRAERERSHRSIATLDGSPISELDATFSTERYRLDADERRANVEKPTFRPQTISGLLESYNDERRLAPATLKAWRRQLRRFIEFVGHDDAHRVAPRDVVRWKEHLRTLKTRAGNPLSAPTINDTYLAAVKAAYGWGVNNHRVLANPASGITLKGPPRRSNGDQHLTDDEARTILRATLAPQSQRLTPQHSFARRWVPWLCAFTGARVNEMTQLRAEDVVKVDGLWTVLITPEAGGQKRQQKWHVPLHPQIIAQGFVSEVEGRKGPLFYDPKLYRGGSEGNPQHKKTGERLAAWVRSLGVTRDEVYPNHGWRHRLMTLRHRHGLDARIADQIEGHAPDTDGKRYGRAEVAAMLREIDKLPWYEV